MKTTRTNMSGLSEKYDVDFDPKWHVDLDESDYDQNSTRRASSILTDTSSPSEPQIPKWRLISLYVSICLGLFLSFLDTSIIATAIYTIGVEFQSLSKVHWIALSYTLAYIGCTAIFASLSDVFGRRNVYIAAAVIFLATSVGCGCAQTLDQLIALRTLQGVGGSGLYSVGFVILPEISSLRMVRMIGAIAGAVIAMSGILGPVVGGLITEYTTWRWIFWINAPLGIVPLVLFTVAYPNATQLRPLQRRSLRQVDYFGFFLLLASAVPLVFSFQEAGMKIIKDTTIWKSPLFIAPIAASAACFIALFGWEWFISKRWPDVIGALFPMRLAKNKVYVSAVLVTMLTGFPYFIVIYSLPVRYQVVNGENALKAGLALLPMLGSSAVGSTLAGAASGKRNNTFPVMVVGAALMLIGTATLTTLKNVVTPQARSYGLQVFIGFGYGLTVSNSGLIAGLTAELRDAAVAQGIIAQVRMLGGSIGIAASSAILGVKQRQLLLATGVISPHQMESLAETMHTLFPQQVFAVRQAYTDAFNETLTVCAAVTGVALLATMGGFQKNPPTMEQRRREQYENEAMRQRLIGEEKARAAALKKLQGS